MKTLGIDVGKSRHNAALLDEDGTIIFDNLILSNDQKGVALLLEKIAATHLSLSGILVGMEATGHYWMNLHATLQEAGFAEVQVVNPIVIHARKNDQVRGAKTDRVDALRIARYLREADHCFSALPGDEERLLRQCARMRYDLQEMASAEKNRLTSLLDRTFPEYHDHFSDLFAPSSLGLLEDYPTAEAIAKVDVRRLTSILQQASRGRLGRNKAEQLKRAARTSFAAHTVQDCLALEIRFVVERLNMLNDQIATLDKQIAGLMTEQQALLQSIPGIGPVWSALILGEILPVFHPEHKNGADKLVAHAGLDATPSKSGKDYDTGAEHAHMSKRGSKYLRTAAIQASQVAATRTDDPVFTAVYQRQRTKEKSHKVAVSHVAHKMLHVIFAVLRDQKTYVPVVQKSE